MREYEVVFVLHPSVNESGVEEEIRAVGDMITASGGTVDHVDRWGRRRLAYEIQKVHEATYTLIQFTSGTEVLREMERRFKLNEQMLRHMVVRAEGPAPAEESAPVEAAVAPEGEQTGDMPESGENVTQAPEGESSQEDVGS